MRRCQAYRARSARSCASLHAGTNALPRCPLQADVWRWFEGPSTIGCEVATMGGPRGPATSYYLPYLSAVQVGAPWAC